MPIEDVIQAAQRRPSSQIQKLIKADLRKVAVAVSKGAVRPSFTKITACICEDYSVTVGRYAVTDWYNKEVALLQKKKK